MKRLYKPLAMFALISGILLSSCNKEDFVEINTPRDILDKITPEQQFLNASIGVHEERFEWYYDNYRGLMPWLQFTVNGLNGNSNTFISEAGNMRNARYNIFYNKVGNTLSDVHKLIADMPAEEQAKRVHQKAIASILKAYYAFYVSDINGSLVYSEGFQGKYGGTLSPKYQTQQELFDVFEQELKAAVTALTAAPSVPQTSLGNQDPYYKGDAAKWARAANSLRLRIAMRLMKRDPAKMATIAKDVLASPAGVIASNADNLTFTAAAIFTEAGDWNPGENTFRAAKPIVDFMWNNSDPRLPIFYQPNMYSQENFNLAKAQGKLPASATYDPRQYYGSSTSPDVSSSPAHAPFFRTRTITKPNLQGISTTLTLDTLSNIQPRLFKAYINNGDGVDFFPIITYADVCFMRAELAARNHTTENAADLYEKGVRGSVENYNDMAIRAKLIDREQRQYYTAVTPAQVTAYLARPEVAYTPANGLEKIISQAYLHFFKQPNEAWALYKRTGMPNSNTVLKLERIFASGTEQFIPRRASITVPATTNLNYQNASQAITDMGKDPDFGAGPSDIFGRVWWDKK